MGHRQQNNYNANVLALPDVSSWEQEDRHYINVWMSEMWTIELSVLLQPWLGSKGIRSFELVLNLRSWTQLPIGSLCKNHYLLRICSVHDSLLSILGQ